MQIGKLKYLGAFLLDILLVGIYKAASLGVVFIFLSPDWLPPPKGDSHGDNQSCPLLAVHFLALHSDVGLRRCPLHIDAY